jgi:hypothetical protein
VPGHDDGVTAGRAEVPCHRGQIALLQPVTLRVVWRRGEAYAQLVDVDEARVLRPGADLVISDVHDERVTLGAIWHFQMPAA